MSDYPELTQEELAQEMVRNTECKCAWVGVQDRDGPVRYANPLCTVKHDVPAAGTIHELVGVMTESPEATVMQPPGSRANPKQKELYSFSLNESFELGGASGNKTLSNQPDVSMRLSRLTCNAPAPGLFRILSVRAANCEQLAGGVSDAFEFSQGGKVFSGLKLTPAYRVTAVVDYTGMIDWMSGERWRARATALELQLRSEYARREAFRDAVTSALRNRTLRSVVAAVRAYQAWPVDAFPCVWQPPTFGFCMTFTGEVET